MPLAQPCFATAAPAGAVLTCVCAALQRSAASSEQRLPAARSAVLAEPWQADYAFLIKTGCLTAQRRVPMQLLTFLSGIRDFILIGAEPGASCAIN